MKNDRFRPLLSFFVLAIVTLPAAFAQTDAGVSVYGAFRGTSHGDGTAESPSSAAGVMFELRHISNPLVGYELNYSFNRADEEYRSPVVDTALCAPDCSVRNGTVVQNVNANSHRVGADWFVSVPHLPVKPYALVGVGLLYISPDGGQINVRGNTKPVFEYGAGVDWTVLPHIGLRFQYRGDLYHSPDLAKAFSSTDKFTTSARPMFGAYFRF